MKTIKDMRDFFVTWGGFSGGWNVSLESYKELESPWGLVAVSGPFPASSGDQKLDVTLNGLAQKVKIGDDQFMVVISNWTALEQAVRKDALRERLLVMISGNLSSKDWNRACEIGGGSVVRRSLVGVPVGQPYWYPTEDQLANGLKVRPLPLP